MNKSLQDATSLWRDLLGEEHVLLDSDSLARYGRTTAPNSNQPIAILRPKSVNEVQGIARIASSTGVALYPISRGKNWGYGDACPAADGQAIIDLSRMDTILEVNRDLAYAVVEPGVTQKQLADYLEENGLDLWLDVTGAGPDTSLVGNFLERGFGHTPYGDHYQHSLAYEIVLADGRVLNTGFGHYQNAKSANVFKYGVGPSLDGIFTQSNFGIVTKMTIWLMRKPEYFKALVFQVKEEHNIAEVVDRVRELRLTSVVQSCLHIGNDLRLISSNRSLPTVPRLIGTTLSEKERLRLRNELGIGPWNGIAASYGTRSMVNASCAATISSLKDLATIRTFDDSKVNTAGQVLNFFNSFGFARSLAQRLEALKPVYGLLKGRPTYDTLTSAFWKCGVRPNSEWKSCDPLDHNVGLLWIAPVLPAYGPAVFEVLQLIEVLFDKYSFDPFITLTSFNARSICCVTNICFDKNSPEERQQASKCFFETNERLMKAGYLPYRSGNTMMPQLTEGSTIFWDVVSTLKSALDPKEIIAPGHYTPLPFATQARR